MSQNIKSILGLLLLLSLTTLAYALREDPPNSGLDRIAWLAGHWRERQPKSITEELWMPPRGKLMLGLNRVVREGRPATFEYMRIEQTEEGVFLFASPGGKTAVRFELAEATKTKAVFVNPEHDFPKRIEYRFEQRKLVAETSGETTGPSWTFERYGDVR